MSEKVGVYSFPSKYQVGLVVRYWAHSEQEARELGNFPSDWPLLEFRVSRLPHLRRLVS